MTDDAASIDDVPSPPGPPSRTPEPIGFCSNCQGPLWAGEDACRVCGRLVVQPQSPPSLAERAPRVANPRVASRALAAVCALAAVLIAVAAGLAVGHWSARQRDEAARRERERQARIQHSLHVLRANNPRARYASYPVDGGTVAFNTTFSTCLVRRVSLKRSGARVSVGVQMLGIRQDSQAPLVNVSLLDDGGHLLARAAIVKYLFATLDQGETHDVNDQLDVPADSEPAIVGIDELKEGDAPPPARAAAPLSPLAYQAQMDGLIGSLRALGYEAYWPHKGREDSVGIVVPDGRGPGASSRGARREIVRSICRRFFEIRRRAGHTATCRVVAQFEPSGYRYTATAD